MRSNQIIGMISCKSAKLNVESLCNLHESLIVGILCRLPFKYVVQCKCVSKHWFNIISHPSFIHHFLSLHDSVIYRPTSLIIKNVEKQSQSQCLSLIDHQVQDNHMSTDSLLSFLQFPPNFSDPNDRNVTVLATYKDLILCTLLTPNNSCYYICNPHTKQWISLPPPPSHAFESAIGFICEPFYDNYKKLMNPKYEFRIVHLTPSRSPYQSQSQSQSHFLELELFRSNLGKWGELGIYCPELPHFNIDYDSLSTRTGIACNGFLYWTSFGYNSNKPGAIIGFHPFCFDVRLINMPCDYNYSGPNYCQLGVCKGHLRISAITAMDTVSVWELKEEDDSKWFLVYQVGCDQFKSLDINPEIILTTDDDFWWHHSSVLALHPSNEDILYMECQAGRIVICNLREKTLTTIITVNSTLRPGQSWRLIGRKNWPFVFEPFWPTPVPVYPKQAHLRNSI